MFFEGTTYYFVGKKGWNEATAHIEFYLQERDLTDVKQCRLGAVAKQNSGVCLPKVGKNKAAATTVCDLHMNMNLLSSLFFFFFCGNRQFHPTNSWENCSFPKIDQAQIMESFPRELVMANPPK